MHSDVGSIKEDINDQEALVAPWVPQGVNFFRDLFSAASEMNKPIIRGLKEDHYEDNFS